MAHCFRDILFKGLGFFIKMFRKYSFPWLISVPRFTYQNVWWLIFLISVTGPWDAQTFYQTVFWVCSVRVFLLEINIWISKLKKAYFPPWCEGASFNQLNWTEKKPKQKELMSWDTGLFPAFRINLKKCLFKALSLLVWGLEIAPLVFMVLRRLESIRTIQSVGG